MTLQIRGTLRYSQWTDEATQKPRSTLGVVAEEIWTMDGMATEGAAASSAVALQGLADL
jgi:hypothetical protein